MTAETQTAQTQTRQTSHTSESVYSQSSDYSSDGDPSTRDADHQPATTSNKHPRTSETVIEKADLLDKDDLDTENSLERMLLSLMKTMDDKILKTASMAKSMEKIYHEALHSEAEALEAAEQHADRKDRYRYEKKKLEGENKSLKGEVDDLKAKTSTLQAEIDAVRKRARELFE